MKHDRTSRHWLAALSIGCFLACSGKLNVGQRDDQLGGAAGSGSALGGSAAGGNASGSGGSGLRPITKLGNPATCPASSPTSGDSCAPEGAACGYGPPAGSTDVAYNQCVCVERAGGELRWDCAFVGTSYASCPASIENGSSCFGHYSTECWYPVSIRCACSQDGGVWDCMRVGRPWEAPPPPKMPEPASPINALSDADREAWCRWYQDAVSGPGFPPLADSGVGPDGKTTDNGCTFGDGAACSVAVAMLSPRQCAQNLAVSECAAPIGNLTDCVATTFNNCVPSPHGCARYLDAGCSGMLVSAFGNGTGGIASAGTGPIPASGTGPSPAAGTDTGASYGGASSGGEVSSNPCGAQVE